MNPRRRLLIIFVIFLVVLTVLAAGLNGLELKEGIKFNFEQVSKLEMSSGTTIDPGFWPLVIKAILALGMLLAPVYLIYMLIDKQRRKRLVFDLALFAILFFLLDKLRESLSKNTTVQDINLGMSGNGPTLEPGVAGTPMPPMPVPSDTMITITAIALGIAAVALLGLLWFMLMRNRRQHPTVMLQLATQAEETIEALITGQNLRETILLCYRRMTEIAAKSRNLPRDISVTPHEFETILVTNGLPTNPVHELTRLFEDVRYGDLNVGEDERQRAVTALRVIAAVCHPVEQAA